MYQIQNLLDDKIYIGVHKSSSLDDKYMGSGKLIQRAINKHGIENFKKTILETFSTSEEMYQKEAEIVNDEFLLRDDIYNLVPGGTGGSIELNRKPFNKNHTAETKKKISAYRTGRLSSDETKQKIRDNHWSKVTPEIQREHAKKAAAMRWEMHPVHREESKRKISETLIKRNEERKQIGLEHPVKGMKRNVVKCPHCGKEGAMNTMSRWHFDNCKSI
jgi:group I intron endonuclease